MSKYRLSKREIKANKRGTIVFTFFIVLIFLLIFLLPQFYVSKIEITGSRVITNEQVVKYANLKEGSHLFNGINGSLGNLFQMRHSKSENMLLENLPYLKSVTIKSVFPSRILVDLNERIEVAYVAINDGCVIIDASGVALEVLSDLKYDGIPVIEGILATQFTCGQKVTVDMPQSLNYAIVFLNDVINADKDTRIDIKLLPRIKIIRPIQNNMLFLTVQLPDNNEELIVKLKNSTKNIDDMIWLRFALNQGKLQGLGKGYLDLTSFQKVFVPEK